MFVRELHILNLGAGVQSTTLALLFEDGRFPVKLDAAIFADTQEESREVYDHLEKLKSRLSFPVIIRTAGKLGDHLMTGTNSTGGRFAPIPAFTLHADGNKGITRRQCTKEYKIDVIERAIRRDVLGLAPRKRIPSGVLVHQYIGISLDEAGRMLKMKNRLEEKPVRWARYHFPLIEELGWTRRDCREYLATKIDYRVPRSACVFCPYHDNSEWARLKSAGGPEWDRVVQIDRALRTPGNVVNRNMDSQLFLHSSCQPIDEIDFLNSLQGELGFNAECLGMCGS
jgi:3'-phosphoadenosine 5'-phosphosulfate sulfotransferase (PAPS reductase)/FAD synthetase